MLAPCDVPLRLPVSRAQFRWAENLLAVWQSGDVSHAEVRVENAYRQHQQTELTQSVTVVLAQLCLRWEQGRLAEGLGVHVDNPFLAPWIDAAVAAARGDAGAADLLSQEVRRPEPTVWTSHGRLTLLAHAVADAGVIDLVPDLLPQLDRLTGLLGSLGHCGTVGPADLARARLLALAADMDAARRALDVAADVAVAAHGPSWQLRVRAFGDELDTRSRRDVDRALVTRARDEALGRGLQGVARDLDRLRGPWGPSPAGRCGSRCLARRAGSRPRRR